MQSNIKGILFLLRFFEDIVLKGEVNMYDLSFNPSIYNAFSEAVENFTKITVLIPKLKVPI